MSSVRLLKRHFQKNKLLASVFFVCQICSVLAFCFLFLYIASIQAHNLGNYIITVKFDYATDKNNILSSIDDFCIEHSDYVDRAYFLSSYNEAHVNINVFYKDVNDKYLMAGFFFDEVGSDQQMPYCISNSLTAALSVGDVVKLNDVEHQVIGISMYKYWEVDRQSISLFSELHDLEIVSSDHCGKDDIMILTNKITDLFPTATITISQTKLNFFECISISECVMFFMAFLIIGINFSGLFMYIIKEDTDVLHTFRLLGCPFQIAFRKTLEEILMLCALSLVTGVVLFQLVVARLISIFNSNFVPYLPWSNIGTITFFYILGVFILFLPLLYQHYRKKIYIKKTSRGKI